MCGVPLHASDAYVARLLDQHFKVVICVQTEVPMPGQKGPLKRAVTKILTPGTCVDDAFLKTPDNNFILVLTQKSNQKAQKLWGLALADFSTGDVFLEEVSGSGDCTPVRLESTRDFSAFLFMGR